MTEFWMEQRQQNPGSIGVWGWQINLSPEDIYEICSGQVAVAWIDRSWPIYETLFRRRPSSILPETKSKLKDDETGRRGIEKKQATSESLSVDGAKVTKYVLPRKAGETTVIESYFVQNAGQLLVADDLDTIKGMLASAKSKTVQGLAATQNLSRLVQQSELDRKG